MHPIDKAEAAAVIATHDLRGLDGLLGQPRGPGLPPIQHGDQVPVLLTGQEDPSTNGLWIAQDGSWQRPPISKAPERPQGFAAMTPERRRRIASMGGRAAHAKGRGHQFSTEEARAAGVKGGAIISANREHMAKIGRRGGNTVVERLGTEHLQEIGRRGGVASSRDRQRMAEIGRKGGRAKGVS